MNHPGDVNRSTGSAVSEPVLMPAGAVMGAEILDPWARHGAMLPATPPEVAAGIVEIENALIGREPVEVPTEHVLHAGMYARTIVMPAGMVLTGALMKRATLVMVCGAAWVLAGAEWVMLDGYHVIPASAGRKQVFVSRSEVRITMVFPTAARSVEEAEAEFTDDAARLLSRRQDANTVVITGE